MALKIRLMRKGTKKKPHQKIVITGQRHGRDANFVEQIGVYNPLYNPPLVKINRERAAYWLKVGAKPTETVENLLKKEGILA
jgi:small subunit ribosomal protein S16